MCNVKPPPFESIPCASVVAAEVILVSDNSLVKEGSLFFAVSLIFPFVLVFCGWRGKHMYGQNVC